MEAEPEKTWGAGPMMQTPSYGLEDRYVLNGNGYYSPSAEWGSGDAVLAVEEVTARQQLEDVIDPGPGEAGGGDQVRGQGEEAEAGQVGQLELTALANAPLYQPLLLRSVRDSVKKREDVLQTAVV